MHQVHHSNQTSQSHNQNHPESPISSSHHSQSRHKSVNPPTATTRDSSVQPPLNMVGPSHPMPRQRVYFGPYLLLQTLGEGEFGKVKLGVHSSPDRWGDEVAIKLIKRGNVDTQARMIKVAREIDVLKLVKHPNIVRLYDVIETEKYIGIVLEYASGGELFDHILAHRYLKEKDAAKLFAQLISGVTYLHAKKIVHRDLKLENLLLDRNRNIIITDFGFANRFEDRTNDLMATSCGSPCYAAPELVVQDGRYVGSQVDVWSCGVILYAMLAGYLPFDDDPSNPDGDNINLLYKYIINTPLSFPDWISHEPKDLLLKMLVPDPLKRCSLKDVTHHSWLAKYQHLFHRSLDEFERISEENEQAKRLLLQRQRQLMATQHSIPSPHNPSIDSSRNQTSSSAAHAQKARGHQSATVVPTSGLLSPDHSLHPHHLTGAYHQQQRQTASANGVVTHLHSNVTTPTPTSNRRQHAQSAIVVPVSQVKDDIPIPSLPTTTHDPMILDQDLKASSSSANSARKRKVGVANSNSVSVPSQQRYTVQVEYTADSKGKAKNVDNLSTPHDHMDIDAMTSTSVPDTVSKNHHPTITSITPPGSASSVLKSTLESGTLTTPQSDHTRKALGDARSPHSRTSTLETPKPLDSGTVHLAEQSPPTALPSPSALRMPSVNQVTPDVLKNLSQVSFGAAQNSSLSNVPSVGTASKSQTRHRKGLSTDRFFSRLLGANVNQPITPPPVPNPKKPSFNPPAVPSATKVSRRKALSMVVEPLSSKANSACRQSKKSVGKGNSTAASLVDSHHSDHSKRRTRGSSVVATPLSASNIIEVPPLSAKPEAAHSQRRITLAAAHGRHPKATTYSTAEVTSAKNRPQPQVVTAARSPSQEETNSPKIDASHQWANYTPAASLANSTGQASNSSKAKRVMDWFRFKSLNGSNTSTNQGTLQVHEHLTPPVPIQTDFDTRSNSNQGVIPARTDDQPVPEITSNQATVPRTPAPLMSSAGSSKVVHCLSSAHPRPNTSTAAESRHPSNHPFTPERNTSYNDSKLRLHHGAIDQNAISSKLPPIIMQQLKQILWEMGIDVVEESPMKLKATRRSKKKVVASLGMGVLEALQQQQQQRLHQQEQSTGALKSIFHRKPQAASSSNHQIGVLIDQFGNVSTGSAATASGGSSNGINTGIANAGEITIKPQPLPSYADDPSVDSGDDVRFTVEITKLRGLVGLYAVDIKRLKGSLWSFKYLYLQILERADFGQKQ